MLHWRLKIIIVYCADKGMERPAFCFGDDMTQENTGVAPPGASDLTLEDGLLFLRRRWFTIAFCTLIAMVASASIVVVRPPVYQSAATLDLPTEAKPTLKRVLPSPLAYQFLLESAAIKEELQQKLEVKRKITPEAKYVLRTKLTAAVPPAVLEATVEASNAELTAAILSEWLELFRAHLIRNVVEAVKEKQETDNASLKLLNFQFTQLQEKESTVQQEFSEKLAQAVLRFQKRCAEIRQRNEELLLVVDKDGDDVIVPYEAETEKLLRESDFKNSEVGLKIQFDALLKTFGALQEEQMNLTFQAQPPENAPLRLQQLAQSTEKCAEKLQTMNGALQTARAKRDALERERAAGLRKLKEVRNARRSKLNDQLEDEIASIEHERDEFLKQLSRSKSDRLASLYSYMQAKQHSIDDINGQPSADPEHEAGALVRVLTPPVVPAQPLPAGLIKYILLGLFGGILAGVALAVIVEAGTRAVQQKRAEQAAPPAPLMQKSTL
jgi:flagellar motility protein MotE (MotC chaperone)